jgi:hypothetical protein
MFGQSPAFLTPLFERLDNSSLLQEASEEAFLAFQCFAETDNAMVLNEASFITDKFIQIIDSIVTYLKTVVAKMVAFLDGKFRSLNSIVLKYRPQIEALDNAVISQLVYEKVTYSISPNIPAVVDTTVINSGIDILSTTKLTRDMVQDIKTKIALQMPILRGQALGLKGPVAPGNFDELLQKTFKVSTDSFQTRMTKNDLLLMMNEIASFQVDKKSIQNTQDTITATLNDYKSQLKKIYSMEFSTNSSDVTIQQGRMKYQVNIIQAGFYKEYQSALTNSIMDIVNVYSAIFDAKISALREKFEREQAIIRQVIYLIQDKHV